MPHKVFPRVKIGHPIIYTYRHAHIGLQRHIHTRMHTYILRPVCTHADCRPKPATNGPVDLKYRVGLIVGPFRHTVQAISFSVVGPSLWNRLPPSARASFLSSNLSTSLSLLKACLLSWS